MINKWYFCLSETTLNRPQHNWIDMIKVAVNSALQNTSLKPYFIYDGNPNDLTKELETKGVNIIYYQSSLYKYMIESKSSSIDIARGAYLRFEIPIIEDEDEFVLYTDCDVIFTPQFNVDDLVLSDIKTMAFAPQTNISDYQHDLNSGVLIFNIKDMKKEYANLIQFAKDWILNNKPGFDQEVLREYFDSSKLSKLPVEYNWKPYWGQNDKAKIIHWHGPKPDAVDSYINKNEQFLDPNWKIIYNWNQSAYLHYLKLWKYYLNS
jgi:lipopolysaccharide biosynthesis glycosyltransferase